MISDNNSEKKHSGLDSILKPGAKLKQLDDHYSLSKDSAL